jgi:quercetin dioxygenase-like cupin family protein
MLQEVETKFSHVKPGDTKFLSGGLRDFFTYRDLGIADATSGKVVAQLVKANEAPQDGTGWHYHVAEFHIVIMLKGWARFMYEDKETLVAAGDCVHQRPGITHYLFDYSPDMEYLEIAAPADFKTVEVEGPCPVPSVTPWK